MPPRALVSLRIDASLRRRLAAAARRRSATPSELVRRALETWLDADEGRSRLSPAESIADLLGGLAGGVRDRSVGPLQREREGRSTRTSRRVLSKRKK